MSGSGTQLGNAILFGGTSLVRVSGGAWDPFKDKHGALAGYIVLCTK